MFIHFLQFQRLYEPDSDPKPAGGGDPAEGFKKLLEKNGSDALRVAELLHGENFKEREQTRALKEQLAALQGKVPGEGAVVLDSAAATQWQAYAALGDVATIQAALKERDDVKAQISAVAREKQITAAAEIAQFKPSVLSQLPGAQDLELTITEVEQAGKKVKTVTVKDGDKQTPLADYAKAKWPDFLPSLQLAPERPAIGSPLNRQSQTPPALDPNQPRKPLARF